MDNLNDAKDYLDKLKKIEEEINDDSPDLSFIGELDDLLKQLNPTPEYTTINKIKVKYKKLNDKASTPMYSKKGDAGLDLVSTNIIYEDDKNVTHGTGISMEIPDNYVGLVFPRSSIRKYGLILSNCVGVIDSGYRGEIQVNFKKTSQINHYNVGDKIAQIIIIPYPQVELIEAENLSDSERGESGFGSTGS